MKKNIITILVILLVIGGISAGPRALTKQLSNNVNNEQAVLTKLTDQQYIDIAVKNCAKSGDGLTASECRCMYTKLINEFGKERVYKLDASANDPNVRYTDREIDIIASCV